MWSRILGRSNNAEENPSSPSSRRKGSEQKSVKKRSESITSTNLAQEPSRGDGRDPGSQPTFKSYSSATRGTFPNNAPASIASSYATAPGEQAQPFSLGGDADIAEQMHRTKAERDERDPVEDRERRRERRMERIPSPSTKRDGKERRRTQDNDDEKRERRRKSDKKEKDVLKTRGLENAVDGYGASAETTRGDFNTQIGEPGFVQFPGQTAGGFVGGPVAASHSMPAHVQEQFPNQFPSSTAEPYRPPLAITEGGPGLAADYYGDAGESVATQPGVRPQQPNLIVGAEPHLQPASSTAAPPPEPSATGHVGAAASFFSGSFESETDQNPYQHSSSKPNVPSSSTFSTRPETPPYTSSASAIPTLGATAAGVAGGYCMASHSSSHEQVSSNGGGRPSAGQRPPSYVNGSYTGTLHDDRPPKPDKQTSHSYNIPLYAAGAAGLPGAISHHNYTSHSSPHPPSQTYASGPTAQRHRHRGPLAKFVDFFKDPDGVAQFEEYTEYIGVCRDCFEPGSTPRDAPRRHRYRNRRSSGRFGSSTRIDKDSRYSLSDSEKRRRKRKPWVEVGVAGYGLSKFGQSLFNQNHGFDDTYSVKSGHIEKSHTATSDRKSYTSRGATEISLKGGSRHRSSSRERAQTRVTSNGRVYKQDLHGKAFYSPVVGEHGSRNRSKSRSRSRSKDREAGVGEAIVGTAIGAVMGSSLGASNTRRSHRKAEKASVERSEKHREHSSERQQVYHRKEKRKKKKGFFNFSSSSSSSSREDLRNGVQSEKRNSRRRRDSKEDHRKAELAVAGLGVAAAALALNETRQNAKLRRRSDLIAVKEPREKNGRGSKHRRTRPESPSLSEEDAWESAPEDDDSVASDLAYGGFVRRRDSRNSLSSESSATSKWGWRWASKKKPRKEDEGRRHDSPDAPDPGITMHSNSSLPLQQMYPLPTSGASRFEGGSHGFHEPSHPRTNARPEPIPIQHPQPMTPVSSAVYSTQAPYEHAYSAPSGPPVFAQPTLQGSRSKEARQDSLGEAVSSFQVPGSFPETGMPSSAPFDNATKIAKSHRRDSSSAKYSAASSVSAAPKLPSSFGDASSAVRFDLTEEQAKTDRRDRRRQAKEENEGSSRTERRKSEPYTNTERHSQPFEGRSRRDSQPTTHGEAIERLHEYKLKETTASDKRSSWTSPVAAAGIASIVGAAVTAQKSSSAEFDEDKERRERRRRRREEREAAANGQVETTNRVLQEVQYSRQGSGTSVWKDLAKIKRTSNHEDYKDFFVPYGLLSKAPEYKQAVADPDADHSITAYEAPEVITIEPDEFYDSREAPAYTFGSDGEELNPHPKSPSWVPKLKLIAPTPRPNSTVGSKTGDLSPVVHPHNVIKDTIADKPPPIHAFEVEVGDQEAPEYTIIEPKGHHDEVIHPPPNEEVKVERSIVMAEDAISSQPASTFDQADIVRPTAGHGDDLDFAATLAAGLEDAGLDPSIVINDPSFRRRDSPPGSEEPDTYRHPLPQSMEGPGLDMSANPRDVPPQQGFVEGEIPEIVMPGAFIDEEAPELSGGLERMLNKKEKKKGKKAKRDELVDEPKQETVGGSKEQQQAFVAEPEPLEPGKEASNRDLQTSLEDVTSVAASAPPYADNSRGKKSKKKSKRGIQEYDGEASVVSAPVTRKELEATIINTAERDQSSKVGLSENSGWDVAGPNITEEAPNADEFAQIPDRKKKNKKSKSRTSTREIEEFTPIRDSQDLSGIEAKEQKPEDKDRKRRSSDGVSPTDSGRITQDLPAKVSTPASLGRAPSSPTEKWLTNPEVRSDTPELDAQTRMADHGPIPHLAERDSNKHAQALAFSGIRQEVPPSPDIPASVEPPPLSPLQRRPSSPLPTEPILAHERRSGAASLPTSPNRRSEFQGQRLSELQKAGNLQSPLSSPSPTAIPFHFRVPPASPGVARSSPSAPQTPFTPDTLPSRPKLRPRSTEFKSSSEFRPLWLVERHGSKQEPTPEENYPSLPSSHTTSRASSVRDPAEIVSDRSGFFDSLVYRGEDDEADDGLLIDSVRANTEAGLLDSQQTTPTATFPGLVSQGNELAERVADPQGEPLYFQHASEVDHAGHAIGQSSESSSPHSLTLKEDTPSSLKDITLGAVLGASIAGCLLTAKHKETQREVEKDEIKDGESLQMEEKREPSTLQKSSPIVDYITSASEHPLSEDGKDLQFAHDNSSAMNDTNPSAEGFEAMKSPNSLKVEPLAVEQQREFQERDAQVAVDSWFAPESPKKPSSGKAGRKKQHSMVKQTKSKEPPPFEASSEVQHIEDTDFTAEESALQEAIYARQQNRDLRVPTEEVSKSLTREMPTEEIVSVMSNAAEADKDQMEDSPLTQNEGASVTEQERSSPTKRDKGRSGKKLKSSVNIAQDTVEESGIAQDRETTGYLIDGERLADDSAQAPPTPAVDLTSNDFHNDYDDQATKGSAASSILPEQKEKLDKYAPPTKKNKKGKKQVFEPQVKTGLAPETLLDVKADIDVEKTGARGARKDVQQEGKPGKETELLSYAADLLYAETLPLPIEEDSEFLSASATNLVAESHETSDNQGFLELSESARRSSDVLSALEITDPSGTTLGIPPKAIVRPVSLTADEPISTLQEPVTPGVTEEPNADDFFIFPVEKGKKGKEKEGEHSAAADIAATQDEVEVIPGAIVPQTQEDLKDIEYKGTTVLKDTSVDDKPGLSKKKRKKERQQSFVLGDPEPIAVLETTPEIVEVEDSKPLAQQSEAEVIKPDEVELPLNGLESKPTEASDSKPTPFVPEPCQDATGAPDSQLPRADDVPTEPSLHKIDEVGQPEITTLQSEEGSIAEVLGRQTESFQGAAGIPTPQHETEFGVAIVKPILPNEKALPNEEAEQFKAWHPRLDDDEIPAATISKSTPGDIEEEHALPTFPLATMDAAEGVQDILSSQAEDRAQDDLSPTRQNEDGSEPSVPVALQQGPEFDELDQAPRKQSRKSQKAKATRLAGNELLEDPQVIAANEKLLSSDASNVAVTHTADAVEAMIEADKNKAPPDVQQQDVAMISLEDDRQTAKKSAENDQPEWEAPKLNKRGKKGKRGRSLPAEDVLSPGILEATSTPLTELLDGAEERLPEPIEDFTIKKSKKDKKNKRKQSMPIDPYPPDTTVSEVTQDSSKCARAKEELEQTVGIMIPPAQDNMTSAGDEAARSLDLVPDVDARGTSTLEPLSLMDEPKPIAMPVKDVEDRYDEVVQESLHVSDFPESDKATEDVAQQDLPEEANTKAEPKAASRPGEDAESPLREIMGDPLPVSEKAAQAIVQESLAPEEDKFIVDPNQPNPLPMKQQIGDELKPSVVASFEKTGREQPIVVQGSIHDEKVLQTPTDTTPLDQVAADVDKRANDAYSLGEKHEVSQDKGPSEQGKASQREAGLTGPMLGGEVQDIPKIQQDLSLEQTDLANVVAVETTEAALDSNSVRKKNKKRGKKSSIGPWKEENASSVLEAEGAIAGTEILGDDTALAQVITQEPAYDDFAPVSNIKKTKKRAKKAKAFEPEDPVMDDLPERGQDIDPTLEVVEDPRKSVAEDIETPHLGNRGKKSTKAQYTTFEDDLSGVSPEDAPASESTENRLKLEPSVVQEDFQAEPDKIAPSIESTTRETEHRPVTIQEDAEPEPQQFAKEVTKDFASDLQNTADNVSHEERSKASSMTDDFELKKPSGDFADINEEQLRNAPRSKKEKKKAKKTKSLSRTAGTDMSTTERDDDRALSQFQEGFDASLIEPILETSLTGSSFAPVKGAEDNSENVPKSKKDKKKAKKSKALLSADEPVLATPGGEDDRVPTNFEQESDPASALEPMKPSIKLANDAGDDFERAPMNKKDRKKAKKSKAISWADDGPDVVTSERQEAALQDSDAAFVEVAPPTEPAESTIVPAKDTAEDFEVASKSKKEKKKAKTKSRKSEPSNWVDDSDPVPTPVEGFGNLAIEPPQSSNSGVLSELDPKSKSASKATDFRPSSPEAERSLEIAQAYQLIEDDPEEPSYGIEPLDEAALEVEASPQQADNPNPAVTQTGLLPPNLEVLEPVPEEREQPTRRSPSPEQTAMETEPEVIVENPEEVDSIPCIAETFAKESQLADEPDKYHSPLHTEASESAITTTSPLTQDRYFSRGPTAEDNVSSDIPGRSPSYEKQLLAQVNSETQLDNPLHSFEDTNEAKQENSAKIQDLKDGLTQSASPSIPLVGQDAPKEPSATDQRSEESSPSTGLDTYQQTGVETSYGQTEREAEVASPYTLKKSKKDKRKAKQPKVLDVDEEIAQSAPRVISESIADPSPIKDVLRDAEGLPRAPTADIVELDEVDLPHATGSALNQKTEDISELKPEPKLDRETEPTLRHGSESTFDRFVSPASPEHAHKRGFFEDEGPEFAPIEEKAIEPPSKAKRTENEPPSQKVVEMEEEVFSTPAKKSKKGKRSKQSTPVGFDTEQEGSVAAQDAVASQPFIASDKIDTEVAPRDQLEGEIRPEKLSLKTMPRDASTVGPENTGSSEQGGQQILEQPTDDEMRDMPVRKAKKGKKSKKSSLPGFDVEPAEPATTNEEAVRSQPSAAIDEVIVPQGQQQDEVNVGEPRVENMQRDIFATIPEKLYAPRQQEEVTAQNAEDAWDMPAKKGKKGKKQRKGAVRIQSKPEIVEASSPLTATPIDESTREMPMDKEPTPVVIPPSKERPEVSTTNPSTLDDVPNQAISQDDATGDVRVLGNVENNLTFQVVEEDSREAEPLLAQEIRDMAVSPLEDNESNALVGNRKKGKKGKKAKKREESLNWEDDTISAPIDGKTDLHTSDAAIPVLRPDLPPSEEHIQQPDHPPDPLVERRNAEYGLQPTSPIHEYKALDLDPAREIEKSGDYFSIQTSKAVETYALKPLSPIKAQREYVQRSPEVQEYDHYIKRSPSEYELTSGMAKRQDPAFSADDKSYESPDPAQAAGTSQDIAWGDLEPQIRREEIVEGDVLAADEQLEAAGLVAPSKKGKDKKSKRDPLAQSEEPRAEQSREEFNGHGTSGSPRLSPTRPQEAKDDGPEDSRGSDITETCVAAGSLGAGAAIAQSLSRRGSKKRGKKDVKSRKGTKRDDEDDESSSLPTPHERVPDFDDGQIKRHERSLEDLGTWDKSSRIERPVNRDSAVHVTDSPIVSEPMSVHRAVRDSGYPDTEASPIVDLRYDSRASSTEREANMENPFFDAATDDVRDSESIDYISRPSGASRDALNISMEADPASIDKLTPELGESRSTRTPAHQAEPPMDSDTAHLAYNGPREPSPVSSTTKDRSSVLFQSSPSTREEAHTPSPQYQHVSEQEQATSPSFPHNLATHERSEPHRSIFGGPTSFEKGVPSPPTSPITAERTPRVGLDIIDEYSPEESPLHKEGRRSPDVGSPDSGIKSRRRTGSAHRSHRSPPPAEHPAKDIVSTDDIISRLSWPLVHDEKYLADLDHSGSRTTDRPTEGDVRSFSGASIRSGESINAIIRTPPGTRSTTGTPPLRRTDRSVSGDLREANRKSRAKKRDNSSEAREAEPVPSSSKIYDPTKDKGKGKVRDMADVYVSN